MTSTEIFNSGISDLNIRKIVSDLLTAKNDLADLSRSPVNLKKIYDSWQDFDMISISEEEVVHNINSTMNVVHSYFKKLDPKAPYLKKLLPEDEFSHKMKSFAERPSQDLQDVMSLFCECVILISKQKDKEKIRRAFEAFPPRIYDLKYLSRICNKIKSSICEIHLSDEQEFVINASDSVLRDQIERVKYYISEENHVHIFSYLKSALSLEPLYIIKANDPYYIVPQAEITSEMMWSILRQYPKNFIEKLNASIANLESEKNVDQSNKLHLVKILQKEIHKQSEEKTSAENLSHIKAILDYKILLSDKAKDHLIPLLKSESANERLIAIEALWVMGERFNGSSPFQFVTLIKEIVRNIYADAIYVDDELNSKNKSNVLVEKLKNLFFSKIDGTETENDQHSKPSDVKRFFKELEKKTSLENQFKIDRILDRYEFYQEEHKEYETKAIENIRLGSLMMSTFPASIIIERIKNHSEEVGILTAQATQLVVHPERMKIFETLKEKKEKLMIDFIGICISFAAKYNDAKLCKYIMEYLITKESHDDLKGLFSESLLNAVRNNNLELVKLFIKSGADINSTNEYGLTALMLAAEVGAEEIVKILLDDERVKVSATNLHGYNALMIAAQKGYFDIVKILQEKGINLNAVGDDGFTALMFAAISGNAKIVKLLLDHGAKYQMVNNKDYDALTLALLDNNVDVVKTLLEVGADPNVVAQDYHGEASALMFAIRKDYLEIIKELLNNKNINVDYVNLDDGYTALMKAAQNGHIEATKMLLAKSANPHIINEKKLNAFKLAQNQEIKDLLQVIHQLQDTLNLMPAVKNKIIVKTYLDEKTGKLNPLLLAKEKTENVLEILQNAQKTFVGKSSKNKDLLNLLLNNVGANEDNANIIKITKSFEDRDLLKAMEFSLLKMIMRAVRVLI